MKFWLSLVYEPTDRFLDYAREAESLGFEGVVLSDHVVIKDGTKTPHPTRYQVPAEDPAPDPLLWFAAMASVTTKLRFLSYVYVVPLRDPFMLAKQVGTLSIISQGRFVLGTGVGWLREEFEAVGQQFRNRGQRTDEILEIARDFWADGYAEFDGQHYSFPRSGMFPVPPTSIPIWVGGHSAAAARRAARFDGYIPMRGLDDETRAEFRLIDQIRSDEERADPFERVVVSGSMELDTAKRVAESDAVTNVITHLWPAGDHTLSFAEKRQLMASFAQRVIAPMASPPGGIT